MWRGRVPGCPHQPLQIDHQPNPCQRLQKPRPPLFSLLRASATPGCAGSARRTTRQPQRRCWLRWRVLRRPQRPAACRWRLWSRGALAAGGGAGGAVWHQPVRGTRWGRWTGPYTPAVFRAAPFALQPAPDGRLLLCVDERVGRVRPMGTAALAPSRFLPGRRTCAAGAGCAGFSDPAGPGGQDDGAGLCRAACAGAAGAMEGGVPVAVGRAATGSRAVACGRGGAAVAADALHALMVRRSGTGVQPVACPCSTLRCWVSGCKPALASATPTPAAQKPDPDVVRQLFEPGAPDNFCALTGRRRR